MIGFIASVFFNLIVWAILFDAKEKQLKRAGFKGDDAKWRIGRIGFLIAFICSFLTAVLPVGFVEILITGEPPPSVFGIAALAVALVMPSILRFRDIKVSPWWASFLVFAPLSIFAALCLVFVPGRHSPREKLPPPLPPRKPRLALPSQIYVAHGDEKQGPYRLSDVLSMVQTGHVTEDAMYWHEKLPAWKPLAEDLPALREMA